MTNKKKNNFKGLSKILSFVGLAFEMMAIIGGGTYLGYILDERLEHETAYFTIALSIFAVFVSTYLVIKRLLK